MITYHDKLENYISLADRPAAAVYGVGKCLAAGVEYISNGTTWSSDAVEAIAAPLTGFTSGVGTVAATDTVLEAINKLDGNVALKADASDVSVTYTTITSITIVNGVVTAIVGS